MNQMFITDDGKNIIVVPLKNGFPANTTKEELVMRLKNIILHFESDKLAELPANEVK